MPEIHEKLFIESLEKDKNAPPVKIIGLQVNPERYSLNYNVKFDNKHAHGKSKRHQRYHKTQPENLSCEFIFDSSGIIPDEHGNPLDEQTQKEGVEENIKRFKNIVLNLNGNIHRPNSVKICWGTLIFIGRLKQLDIEYKLFRPNGIPVRAVAKATFLGSREEKYIEALDRKSSPDLTHVRSVKQNDTLALLTEKIYGDPLYFFQVAKANRLVNFRKLKPGQQLRFPPLAKI